MWQKMLKNQFFLEKMIFLPFWTNILKNKQLIKKNKKTFPRTIDLDDIYQFLQFLAQ